MSELFAHPMMRRMSLGGVLFLLVAGIAVIVFSNSFYRDEQRGEANTQAAVVAASTVAALDFGDRTSARDYLMALSANPRVVRAELFDEHGHLFVVYHRPGISGRETTIDGRAPVLRQGQRIGTVILSEMIDPWWRRMARYSIIVLLVILAGLVVAVLALGQAALHRANEALSQEACALAEANAALAVEIEERGRAEEQLRQAQKMQALGQLTGGIAHDFNNLLTVMRGTADLLRRPDLPEERRARYIEAIAQTADRATQLTSQLLAFSRRQPLEPKVVDLNERLQDMMVMFGRVLGPRYDVKMHLAPDLCAVEVDPTQFEVAVLNIVVNARDAMSEGGTLTIATMMVDRQQVPDVGDAHEKFAAIRISDTGVGMDSVTIARAMEPFFTTKSVGKGTGLGLSQVYGFATQSGGSLAIDSAVGAGTSITLTLPCSSHALEPPPRDVIVAAEDWRGRILFVEDNVEVAVFARTLLEELGHEVIHAPSGEAALEIARGGTPFDFVFSDIVMSGISGFDLADQLRTLRPDVPILLATGYSDRLSDEGSAGLPVLAKPYSLTELAQAIAGARANNSLTA